MKVGLTYDHASDYGMDENSRIFADFCFPGEVEWILSEIDKVGFEAVPIGNMYKLNDRIRSGTLDCDIVLIMDEGIMSRNREAIVPALLELNKIPYIGSDAYCMGLSQNKYHTKLIVENLGIRCPKGIYLEYDPENMPDINSIKDELGKLSLDYPLIVKPNEEGYSMGVFVVRSDGELADALDYNFGNYKEPVLVEEFISGRELFIPIVGNGSDAYTYPIGAVMKNTGKDIEFFSLEEKYNYYSHYEIAKITEDVKKEISESALKIYRHLKCRDLGRFDYRLDENGRPVLIELNPRPGMTEDGPFAVCGKEIGKTYEDTLKEIILCGAKRYGLGDN